MPNDRICSTCKEPKPETEEHFYVRKNANGTNQFKSTCKICSRKTDKGRDRRFRKGETLRECTGCKKKKPLSLDYFSQRTSDLGERHFRHRCRVCARSDVPERDDMTHNLSRPGGKEVVSSKVCSDCAGMSWRVNGIRCKCGLRYGPEPKVELVTHRYFEKAI